ncbi:MAG: hypothetical protein U1F71_21735 [Verrucomicrobiaceae bacterium]
MKHLLVLVLMLPGFVHARTLGFSQMEDGDRIEVTLRSTGCFHDYTFYYEFRKDKGSHLFTEYAITWKRSPVPEIEEKKAMGTLKLTAQEITGLDALLEYYRSKKDGSSTTQVSLVVEFYEPGRQVGVERLFDQTGGFGLENRKDVVTFRALSEQIKGQAAR